ncbi:hypothetical protein ASPBRDRAFT_40987 [Aspergillus brasiliensis CBS 101740]|uniref:Uncharacterized protein n=1 Tax=Aspergillus brasiliensis (strain CBS 101740 / IMI 381727 / IBT 21946) TaxID=767769 RepID=A0A1L9UNW5_ASPBC|nr:hypothetical protein ASPBRDRAFT_40987 [Aspergillus brasiliensis CBS 101740]
MEEVFAEPAPTSHSGVLSGCGDKWVITSPRPGNQAEFDVQRDPKHNDQERAHELPNVVLFEEGLWTLKVGRNPSIMEAVRVTVSTVDTFVGISLTSKKRCDYVRVLEGRRRAGELSVGEVIAAGALGALDRVIRASWRLERAGALNRGRRDSLFGKLAKNNGTCHRSAIVSGDQGTNN